MSDKDVISRGDAKGEMKEHQMSAREYLPLRQRMHISFSSCIDCPMSHFNNGKARSCRDFEFEYPAEAVAIVEKWTREHPEERSKE